MMYSTRAAGALILAAITCISLGAAAASAQARTPRIVNGVLTSDYPTTGALLKGSSTNTADTWCSGTLIGCNTFLTAGHCVEDDLNPAAYFVFLQHAGIFAVSSIDLHPSYSFPVADVAVLKLATSVTGIRPTRINTIADPPFGSSGIIAGFGRSGGTSGDYGLKRAGAVSTSSCSGAGESNVTSVCWEFDAPQGPPGSNSNTCNADSGGPLFLTLGGTSVVAGITSGGIVDSCLTGDVSYDADVYNYRSYIQSKGGSDIDSTICGAISPVGDSDTIVSGFSGSLSAGSPQGLHSFVVPVGTIELRVAMNAVDDGSDFNLYVKRGSAPTVASFDCARSGSNQYGVCTFDSPAVATWYALVQRVSGSGSYQLTASRFGGCSNPANNGLACDDGNSCTTGDVCGGGTCNGSVVNDGTVCASGSLCSGPLICQAGTCSSGPANPATGCKQTVVPAAASLLIKDSDNDKGDKVQWKWKGEATFEFGDPTASTDYAFCVYDQTSGVQHLVIDQDIPAGSSWQALSSGYKYSDSTSSSDGVRSVKLHDGVDGRASISVLGRGPNLNLAALPLDQQSEVLVQLVTDQGLCWEAHYGSHSASTVEQFRAKSD